jgi:peptide-methionine (S)-S-oxide reductase
MLTALRWTVFGMMSQVTFTLLLLANSETTPKVSSMDAANKVEVATFGAGCFWGVEYNFRTVPGVLSVYSGYAGGKTDNPTYREVCSGDTNHAEVVQVTFNPDKVPYRKLVEYFFRLHDPTQVNRQGPDYGTQYRSVIFWHSEAQKKIAESVMQELTTAKKYKSPIATQLVSAGTFWKAEEYHQRYFEKNGGPTCHVTEF